MRYPPLRHLARTLTLLGVGLETALCAALGGAQADSPQDAIPLRIVTFNAEILTAPGIRAGSINKFRFDYARERHLERIAGVIETLNPDILNLVEVTSAEAVDRLVEILHEKGMSAYRGYHVEGHDTFTGLDVAVITRYPPAEIDGQRIRTIWSAGDDPTWRQAYEYPGRDGRQRRGTASLSRNALYFISVGTYKLGFLGLHLKSNPDDAYSNARRSAEAEVARRVLRGEIAARDYLPIVLGDLNDYDPDVPDRDESRATSTTVLKDLKNFDPSTPDDELVNVAEQITRQADRYTSHWDWNENGAHDGDDVYTMLDHVLLAKALLPFVQRVFICRCTSVDTSDHYPVVVDLLLPADDKSPAAKKQ